MLKSPYDAIPQTPLSPGTPLTPRTPGTPQYNESYPLTAQNPSLRYPTSPPPNDYYDRSTKEPYASQDNSYTPVANAQPTSLLHQDLIEQDRVSKFPTHRSYHILISET